MKVMTKKWWALSAVASGTFMATLDSSIVNIALPTITKELGEGLSISKWVIVIYLIVISGLLLPIGKISDLYGRRKVFALGLFIFALGSFFCGVSTSFKFLIFSRAIQGLGAAMLMANGPAIIATTFPSTELGKALGTLAMVVSVGLISGPSLGGLIISQFGWREIFWINIPVAFLGILFVFKYIKKDPIKKKKFDFDWLGAFLQLLIVLLLIFIFDPPKISVSGSSEFGLSRIIACGLIFIFTSIFLRIELLSPDPLVDLELLKNRNFLTGNLAGFFCFLFYSSVAVLMPFYLQDLRGFSPQTAGFYMTTIPLVIFITAPITGRLSDQFGSKELSVLGSFIGGLTLFSVAGTFGGGIAKDSSSIFIVTFLLLIGLAMGVFQSPNNNAIMGSVPAHKLGLASAMLATIRNMGMFVGVGLSTQFFLYQYTKKNDYILALRFAFGFAAVYAILAMIASSAKKRGPSWRKNNDGMEASTKKNH